MPHHVVIAVAQPGAQRGVALQGQRAGVERCRDLVPVDQAADPPDPHPAAVLHVGFRAEVADFGPVLERGLAPGVVDPVLAERVLAALLVVDHQVDGHERAAWPADGGRLRAVADEIALGSCVRIGHDVPPW